MTYPIGRSMHVIIISLSDDCTEILSLARTLDFEVEQVIVQHRDRPHPQHYIGSGKMDEVKAAFTEMTDAVIANSELKPVQLYNLARHFEIEVYDRIRLVLEIFTKRAHSREAKLQVELARLEYELPKVRELIHRSRHGEHPGYMALGEYQIEQYYRMLKKRMVTIKRKLESMRVARGIRRAHRRERGFYLVSLVGYTNAGKSTLMNRLTDEEIEADDQLFSTLATTTRRSPDMPFGILFTDTVGFLEDLPHWLIEAFRATLEEIYLSDVILLLFDISEELDEIERKLNTSLEVLWSFEYPLEIMTVANKIDTVADDELARKLDALQASELVDDPIAVSATSGAGLDELRDALVAFLPDTVTVHLEIPNNSETQSFISWLHDTTNILDIKYPHSTRERPAPITMELECRAEDFGIIEQKAAECGSTLATVGCEAE